MIHRAGPLLRGPACGNKSHAAPSVPACAGPEDDDCKLSTFLFQRLGGLRLDDVEWTVEWTRAAATALTPSNTPRA